MTYLPYRRIYTPNRSCWLQLRWISIRVYAPEPYARFRTEQGGLRGRRSTRHEESEIDKAHVLHAAESPWLEVSTVGLSCRLLIAGTMQQMALIAIPYPTGLPALEFSFVLFLSHSEQRSPFFGRRHRRRRFSRIFLRGPPPRRFDPDISRLHVFDFISQTSVPLKDRGRHPRISSWSLFWSVAHLKVNASWCLMSFFFFFF